jgi:hypothetical protein
VWLHKSHRAVTVGVFSILNGLLITTSNATIATMAKDGIVTVTVAALELFCC